MCPGLPVLSYLVERPARDGTVVDGLAFGDAPPVGHARPTKWHSGPGAAGHPFIAWIEVNHPPSRMPRPPTRHLEA
jgi:hypothetical protein